MVFIPQQKCKHIVKCRQSSNYLYASYVTKILILPERVVVSVDTVNILKKIHNYFENNFKCYFKHCLNAILTNTSSFKINGVFV